MTKNSISTAAMFCSLHNEKRQRVEKIAFLEVYLSCVNNTYFSVKFGRCCTFILCNFKLLFLSKFLPDYLTLLKILISTRNRVTSMAILK